jgi:hypothetical protein
MIDPDHFHKDDTIAETQAKRIALTWDIQLRYAPLFEKVLARPMDDPTRARDWDMLVKRQKAEMDKRFAEAKKKPIIKPVKIEDGHQIKGGRAGLGSFIFNLGGNASTCKRCGKLFIKSKTRRKYCGEGCRKLAKTDSHTQKRRVKNQSSNQK